MTIPQFVLNASVTETYKLRLDEGTVKTGAYWSDKVEAYCGTVLKGRPRTYTSLRRLPVMTSSDLAFKSVSFSYDMLKVGRSNRLSDYACVEDYETDHTAPERGRTYLVPFTGFLKHASSMPVSSGEVGSGIHFVEMQHKPNSEDRIISTEGEVKLTYKRDGIEVTYKRTKFNWNSFFWDLWIGAALIFVSPLLLVCAFFVAFFLLIHRVCHRCIGSKANP